MTSRFLTQFSGLGWWYVLEAGSRVRGAGFLCGGDNKYNFGLNVSPMYLQFKLLFSEFHLCIATYLLEVPQSPQSQQQIVHLPQPVSFPVPSVSVKDLMIYLVAPTRNLMVLVGVIFY